jgi:hypothetical protein
MRDDPDVPGLGDVRRKFFDFLGCRATHDTYVIPIASRTSPPDIELTTNGNVRRPGSPPPCDACLRDA